MTMLTTPLHPQRHRLGPGVCVLAETLCADVGLNLDWEFDSPSDGAVREQLEVRLLVYTLESGTAARVKQAVETTWPSVRIDISEDKVGNPALRQLSRNADLIVLATRRAAHAATGFITGSATRAIIRYADGAGSASMLRAVEVGLADLAG